MSGNAPAQPGLSNLQLRIASALVLGVMALAVTWFGGLAFRVFAALIAAAIYHEWTAMAGAKAPMPSRLAGAGLLAAALIAFLPGYPASPLLLLVIAAALVFAVVERLFRPTIWAAAGFGYAALSGLSLGWLRGDDRAGLVAILFLFATVWATDIFAYFVGRRFGGPKLAPAISPGKTWSGAIGGAVAGVIAGLIVAGLAGAPSLTAPGVVALVLSVVSQAGDLFESWVKRRHGAKDSGSLIPGHGGVMDRVDGLVAAAFALFVIRALAGAIDNPAQALFGMP